MTDAGTDHLRALVIAGSPLARAGLVALLNEQIGVDVVGQIGPDGDLGDTLPLYRADVVIWDMGWDAGAQIVWLADVRDYQLPVLVLVADADSAAENLGTLLAAGARGILLEDSAGERLAAALYALVDDMVVIDSELADMALPEALRARPPEAAATVESLTPREREVLLLIAEGLANKTIGVRLGISEHTVKFHINAILTKLGAQSRTEAVVQATRLGLIAL